MIMGCDLSLWTNGKPHCLALATSWCLEKAMNLHMSMWPEDWEEWKFLFKNQSSSSSADLLASHSPGSCLRKTAAAFRSVFDNGVIELLASILSNLDPSVYQESSILQQIIRKPYIFNPKPGSKYYLMLDDSAGTSYFTVPWCHH